MQNLLHEPAIEGIVVNFRDISNRIEMEKQNIYISTHDYLTNIPNLRYFKQKLELQLQYAKTENIKCSIMMIDIDGLKYINDALGYQVGDQLIIEITKRLKESLDDSIFFSRYSGVVFALIVNGKETISEYEKLAIEIIALFLRPFKVDNYELSVTSNIGICISGDNDQDIDLLVNHSEIALFLAKKEGKNRYKFYSSDVNIQNYKQFQLRNDLRKAVSNNQFKAYLQPMVNLRTNEILAAEALIRWEHPIWGMVSPSEFITLAEETGEIINIGRWLLKEACRSYKKWLEQGLPNIEETFVESVINTIDEFGLDPHFLIMEITESILMSKLDKAIADIERLQSLGIQVALDDFGTGYSSLAYLHSFNVDILKIDSSFVKSSVMDNSSSIILKSIVNMTRELKIMLVAEGIENWQQLSYLKGLNCHTGQGYIFAKPQSIEDFEKILVKRKCRPIMVNDSPMKSHEDRREYFRIKFPLLLESNLTILGIKGKRVNIGNTKVLIKNLGPGGLCFITNLNLPVDKDIILQFVSNLLGEEIRMHGSPVWAQEIDNSLFEYGVKFALDENKRIELTRILNQIQIKMRNNILFSEGSFVSESHGAYFKKNWLKELLFF